MNPPLKVAIAGLGTVGAGVLKLLARNGALVARRCGRPIEVVAVSARSRGKDRGVDLTKLAWFDDPVAMAGKTDADAIVELIGGEVPARGSVAQHDQASPGTFCMYLSKCIN